MLPSISSHFTPLAQHSTAHSWSVKLSNQATVVVAVVAVVVFAFLVFILSGKKTFSKNFSVAVEPSFENLTNSSTSQPTSAQSGSVSSFSGEDAGQKLSVDQLRSDKAIVIQRYWRAYLKKKQNCEDREELLKMKRDLEQRQVQYLNPMPPLAEEQKINEEGKQYYLEIFNCEEAKKIAEMMINHHMMHIGMSQFQKELQRCVQQFNLALAKQPEIKEFLFAYTPNKSQGWVADLALRYLAKMPIDAVMFPNHGRHFEFTSYIAQLKGANSALVILDDCSYSGLQMSEVIDDLSQTILTSFKEDGIGSSTIKIFLIIPYMTSHAKNRLTEMMKKNRQLIADETEDQLKVDFRLMTSHLIPTIDQLPISENDLKIFNRILGSASDTQALVYCDWKKPDFISMPIYFANAYVPYYYNRFTGQRTMDVEKSDPWFFSRPPFLPDIRSPYKT